MLAIWTSFFAAGILWYSAAGAPEKSIRAATRLWARGVLATLRVVVGLEHAEIGSCSETPCLIISNHQSAWETLAFLVMVPDVAIIAKKELLSVPVLGWYLRRSPMIIIDRASGAKSFSIMLAESRRALSNGRSVLIFPEGSRKPPDEPVKFKRGAGLLYAHLGVPALPVALNSGSYWSGLGAAPKSPGRITVSYLPVIQPGLTDTDFTKLAETMIEQERRRISHLAKCT